MAVSIGASGAELKRVAVLDFRNPADLPAQEVDYITELVRTEARRMLPRETFLMMTKENILEILPPEKRDLTKCMGACEVETGRLLQAHYLVTGDIVRFGGELRVTMRLYDVVSGNLLESRKVAGKKSIDLEAPIEEIAPTLFAVVTGARIQVVPSTPPPVPLTDNGPSMTSTSASTPVISADPQFEKLVRAEQAKIEAQKRIDAENRAKLDADYLTVKAIHDNPSNSDEAKKTAYQSFVQKWPGDTQYRPTVEGWIQSSGDMVRISGSAGTFWMDKTEVTQSAYQQAMGTNLSKFAGCPNCPVEMVSWDDANNYCRKIGKRLPTESEWEYAARGGTISDTYGDLDSIAWYDKNSGAETHPVFQKQPNAYGLYDTLGNVWEWTSSWSDSNQTDRVLRGGSWRDNPRFVRASTRFGLGPSFRNNTVGFRCVRNQ